MPDEVLILENNCMLIYAELLTPTEGDFPVSSYYVFFTVHSLIKTQKSETPKPPPHPDHDSLGHLQRPPHKPQPSLLSLF